MNRARVIAMVAAGLGLGLGTAAIVVDDIAKSEGRARRVPGTQTYVPYQDPVGRWTVCDGITGAAVIPGKVYTDTDCDDLLAENIIRHGKPIVGALRNAQPGEYAAWIDQAYNAGVRATLDSTGLRLQMEGRRAEACAQILRWTWATCPSKRKINCRDRNDRCEETGQNCIGIAARRDRQYARCMQNSAALSHFEVT